MDHDTFAAVNGLDADGVMSVMMIIMASVVDIVDEARAFQGMKGSANWTNSTSSSSREWPPRTRKARKEERAKTEAEADTEDRMHRQLLLLSFIALTTSDVA